VRAYGEEREALLDAMDLAGTMTLKAALAGLPCGGGKIVVIDRPGLRRGVAMTQLARLLRTLRGRFFAGRDLGMTGAELRRLRRLTRYAAVEPSRGEGTLGDATARGTVAAIQAALTFSEERRNGSSGSNGGSGLGDALVAVQGLGAVGLPIARRLLEAGARVAAWDPDPRAAEQGRSLGVRIVRPSRLVSLEADVFVPAASGGLVDEAFSRRCSARIVCGPANNQLAFRGAEEILARRGIVYVPDVLVGAGALIASRTRMTVTANQEDVRVP